MIPIFIKIATYQQSSQATFIRKDAWDIGFPIINACFFDKIRLYQEEVFKIWQDTLTDPRAILRETAWKNAPNIIAVCQAQVYKHIPSIIAAWQQADKDGNINLKETFGKINQLLHDTQIKAKQKPLHHNHKMNLQRSSQTINLCYSNTPTAIEKKQFPPYLWMTIILIFGYVFYPKIYSYISAYLPSYQAYDP